MAEQTDADDGASATARRERLLQALLTSATIRDACATADVPERTAYRWLREDDAFKADLAEAKRALLGHGLARLKGAMGRAVSVLLAVAEDQEQDGRARVAAAGKVVELGLRAEADDLAARLDALEAATGEV